MTKTEIVVLVISSGLAAGLVQSLVTLWAGRSERSHRSHERQAVEKHAATLRREAAHDAARAIFLPKAESLAAWADHQAGDLHWDEVGSFHPIGTLKPVPQTQAGILDLLREIMYGHPTKAVRDQARTLFDSISSRWGEVVGDRIPDPTLDDVLDWLTKTEDLIELIHTPEASV